MKKLNSEDDRYFDEIQKLKVKCSCGHSQTVFMEKAICDWCGKWVYRDPKQEFKDRVKEKIRRM